MSPSSSEWRARVTHTLAAAGDSDAAPFCHAVIHDLWAIPRTRKEFDDPFEVFSSLHQTVTALRAATNLDVGAPPAAAEARLGSARSLRGEVQESLVWLSARPEWLQALERHHRSLPARTWWRSAVLDLLRLLRNDADAPDLDVQPAELQRAAAAQQHRLLHWRTELVPAMLPGIEPDPAAWMVAVVETLWEDERTRHEFPHEAAIAERMLEMLAYSAAAFVDYSLPDEDEDDDGPADPADLHPMALEGLINLNDHLIYLRRNPLWLEVMVRHAQLLPEGRWSDALESLKAVVEHLDATAPKPSPSRGGTYHADDAPAAEALSFDPQPTRIKVAETGDSLYFRKHWRREIRRPEDITEPLAAWIEATADEIWSTRRKVTDETDGPHRIAWRLMEMVTIAAAAAWIEPALLDPRARTTLREHVRFVARHPEWVGPMKRHAAALEDESERDTVLTLLSPKKADELLRKGKPVNRDRWQADLRLRLSQTGRGGNESLLSYLFAVTADLWTDPRGREEFDHESALAGHLLRMIGDAGLAYVVPDTVPAHERDSLVMRILERSAQTSLGSATLEWLAQRPHWSLVMERHAHLLQGDDTYAGAVAQLVRAAREHEVQPVQGPNATGDWRIRVERRVTRLGVPEVVPFFLHAVELAWEGAPAPTEFATAYDLYERLEGAIISIASAFVIPRLALKHPELTAAIDSARDPKPARDRAKQQTIPWLRTHPGCVSALRKSLHLLPRDHLFIAYVEATLAAASGPPPASRERRNRKKKRK